MEMLEALALIESFITDTTEAFNKDCRNNKGLYKDLKCIGVFNKYSHKVKQAIKLAQTEYDKIIKAPQKIKNVYLIPYKPAFGKTNYLKTECQLTISDKECIYCGTEFLVQNPALRTPNEYFCPHCQKVIYL